MPACPTLELTREAPDLGVADPIVPGALCGGLRRERTLRDPDRGAVVRLDRSVACASERAMLEVEAAGVEPASANGSAKASTCVLPCRFRHWARPRHRRPGASYQEFSSPARQHRRETSPNCRRLSESHRADSSGDGLRLRTNLTQPAPCYRWRLSSSPVGFTRFRESRHAASTSPSTSKP